MNTNGINVGDRTPPHWFDYDGPTCPAARQYHCTAVEGHHGPHVATGSGLVLEVWS
jgi:hypothetical protein